MTLSGYTIAHPLQPELQGTFTFNLTDAHGKYNVRNLIDIVNHTGYGYLKYYYQNPSDSEVESKTTFVSGIPNSNWYSGAGFYIEGNEPYYNNSKKSEKEVTEAVNFFGQGIAAILPTFAGDTLAGVQWMRTFLHNIRFFEGRSGYFFVIDYNGYNVVQPPEPS